LCSCSLINGDAHKIVPTRHFFANSDGKLYYKISPNAEVSSWFEVEKGERVFKLKNHLKNQLKSFEVPFESPYLWVDNNRYISFPIYYSNEKKMSIAIFDTHNPDKPYVKLMPEYQGSLFLASKMMSESGKMLIKQVQKGEKNRFFVFNLTKMNPKEIITLGDNVENILMHNDLVVAQTRQENDRLIVEILDRQNNQFKPVSECHDRRANINLISYDEQGYLNYFSDCKSEYVELIRTNGLDEKKFNPCNKQKVCDASFEQLIVNPQTGLPEFGIVHRDKSHIVDFSNRINYQPINQLPGIIEIVSHDIELKKLIIKNSYYAGVSYYAWDTTTHSLNQLSKPQSKKYETVFSKPEFVNLIEHGESNLFGYYYAAQTPSIAAPAIILLHGGPTSRSYPDYDKDALFLSNRGYHVLSLNYRGSVGFGKHYQRQAQNNPKLMVDDILQSHLWLRKEKSIEAPIGLFGASYGGYLSLLAIQSDAFSCAASINGIVDLHENAIRFPVQENSIFVQYFGEKLYSTPEVYDAFSPIKIDYTDKKILLIHSEYDSRVPIDLTEKFYQLNKDKNQIQFSRLEDGHGLSNWYSRLEAYRDVELFFSDCLGGDEGGFDFYLLAKPFYK
jgi:alpha/beta superfamily hydrolase